MGGLGLGWPDEAGAVANRASVKRDGVPVYAQMATTSDVVVELLWTRVVARIPMNRETIGPLRPPRHTGEH